jgi:hypothetical protein
MVLLNPHPPRPHPPLSHMYTTYNPTPSPHPLSSRSCTLRFFVVLRVWLFPSSQSLLGGNSFRTDFRDPRFGEVLVSFLSLWLTRWMDPVIRLVQTRGIESLSVSVWHSRLRLTFPKHVQKRLLEEFPKILHFYTFSWGDPQVEGTRKSRWSGVGTSKIISFTRLHGGSLLFIMNR